MSNYAEILRKNVGELIRQQRLSQTEFADFVGVHRPVISRIMNGHAENPTLSTLASIAVPCRKTVEWLITDHEKMLKDVTPEDALTVLENAVKELKELKTGRSDRPSFPEGLSNNKRALISLISTLDDSKIPDLMDLLSDTLGLAKVPEKPKKTR